MWALRLTQGPGGISAPPSVSEGSSIDVEYDGEGPVYYQVDLGEWKELEPDPTTGERSIQAPSGGRGIIFSDRKGPNASSVSVEILATGNP